MTEAKEQILPPLNMLQRTHASIHAYNVPRFAPSVDFTIHLDQAIGRRTVVSQVFNPDGELVYSAKLVSNVYEWLREKAPQRVAWVTPFNVTITDIYWIAHTPEE